VLTEAVAVLRRLLDNASTVGRRNAV